MFYWFVVLFGRCVLFGMLEWLGRFVWLLFVVMCAEIVVYCVERGLLWCEDVSNVVFKCGVICVELMYDLYLVVECNILCMFVFLCDEVVVLDVVVDFVFGECLSVFVYLCVFLSVLVWLVI